MASDEGKAFFAKHGFPTYPDPAYATVPAAAATPAAPAVAATTSTPAPVYTYSEGNVVAYTAASLKGVSPKLAEGFERMYPGHHVVINLDGTQALKTQVQNGAYADVFISASNSYTTELTKGGYFVDGTVKPLTSNYVIVILPANNPGKIQSLSDLAKPGVKIARADKNVPVGTATNAVIANLAKKPAYGAAWETSVNTNTITYETSEPAVASKVALGEVDAGFVYESTATAAKPGTISSIAIPREDNYLQTYTIGVLKGSTSKGAAADFETFMLSTQGQQILKDYGFRAL
ncbi:MAG: molybdate ABC transporter substrate-binding protein [Methanomicrobiales archaeon]|nr:molybdate ABC transporter substrate-binding protein [Methanomicrobiales archaeon]